MLAVTGMSEFHSETESAEETGLAIQEFQAVSPRQHAFHFRVQAEGKVVPDGKTDVVSRRETVFMVPVIQEGLAVRDKLKVSRQGPKLGQIDNPPFARISLDVAVASGGILKALRARRSAESRTRNPLPRWVMPWVVSVSLSSRSLKISPFQSGRVFSFESARPSYRSRTHCVIDPPQRNSASTETLFSGKV